MKKNILFVLLTFVVPATTMAMNPFSISQISRDQKDHTIVHQLKQLISALDQVNNYLELQLASVAPATKKILQDQIKDNNTQKTFLDKQANSIRTSLERQHKKHL